MNINSFKQFDPDLGLAQAEQVSLRQPQVGPSTGSTSGFFEALENSMQEVNTNQLAADNSIKDLVSGKNKNIHETMLQIQKADLSLKTMMQVRNKILEAYKEIIRMQV
jgi:flagellar hook-basal body complex protein FliE